MNAKDIERIFSCIAADFEMIADSTGLWTEEQTGDYLEDVKAFMDKMYLQHIHLILKDKSGNQIRARRYTIGELDKELGSVRPGDNDWSELDGETINIILSYSDSWGKLSEEQKTLFKSRRKIRWSTTMESTDFEHLTKNRERLYTSGNSVIKRIDFK